MQWIKKNNMYWPNFVVFIQKTGGWEMVISSTTLHLLAGNYDTVNDSISYDLFCFCSRCVLRFCVWSLMFESTILK